MNVKIADQTLIFKVKLNELERLLIGETLEVWVRDGEQGRGLSAAIVPIVDCATEVKDISPDDWAWRVIDQRMQLTLWITQQRLHALATLGRSREGLVWVSERGGRVSLRIDIRGDRDGDAGRAGHAGHAGHAGRADHAGHAGRADHAEAVHGRE